MYAAWYLRKHGLRLLERNFTCRVGEIDLIMLAPQSTCVVFVEVRYRRHSAHGSPVASITREKQLRLVRTASLYLARRTELHDLPARFDVLGIAGLLWRPRVEWIAGAFEV